MAVASINKDFANQFDKNQTETFSPLVISLPSNARFWILLALEIPSLACSLILLYYLFFDRTLRHALNNHVVVALLIVGLIGKSIDVPLHLTFLRLGYVWPAIPVTCYLWWFAGTAIYNLTGFLMAWASIERHILVFHQQWLSTQKRIFIIHYLPLAILVLYCLLFYTINIFFPSCVNTFDYTQNWCGVPCYDLQKNTLIFDVVTNGIVPTLLIVIFNILLLIRVIAQKRRLRQEVQWRKYRRMIVQLFSIASIFLLFNLPFMSILLARLCGVPYGAAGQFELYTYFFVYFITLLMPFVCLGSLPEIWTKMKRVMRLQHTPATVTPITMTMRPVTTNHPMAVS